MSNASATVKFGQLGLLGFVLAALQTAHQGLT